MLQRILWYVPLSALTLNEFQRIKSLEGYEALKVNQSDLLVGWFTANWSTAGKLYEGEFDKLASQYPQVG